MQKPWFKWAFALVCGVLVVSAASAQTAWPDFMATLTVSVSKSPQKVTLPADVKIAQLPADAPADVSRWLGVWSGYACRDFGCDIKVAIENIEGTAVTLVYGWANATQVFPAERLSGDAINGEIRAKLRGGGSLVLRLRANNAMEMVVLRPNNQWAIAGVLTKSEAPSRP